MILRFYLLALAEIRQLKTGIVRCSFHVKRAFYTKLNAPIIIALQDVQSEEVVQPLYITTHYYTYSPSSPWQPDITPPYSPLLWPSTVTSAYSSPVLSPMTSPSNLSSFQPTPSPHLSPSSLWQPQETPACNNSETVNFFSVKNCIQLTLVLSVLDCSLLLLTLHV